MMCEKKNDNKGPKNAFWSAWGDREALFSQRTCIDVCPQNFFFMVWQAVFRAQLNSVDPD